jgi:hypothetical protein
LPQHGEWVLKGGVETRCTDKDVQLVCASVAQLDSRLRDPRNFGRFERCLATVPD